MQTPVSRTDTITRVTCILEDKTSPEGERFLTSSSRKGAKHPVEQREQLKGELIHGVLHEMRMDESKLSVNQVHCVCRQGRDAHLPALLLSKGQGVIVGNTFLNCIGKRHCGKEGIEEIKTFNPCLIFFLLEAVWYEMGVCSHVRVTQWLPSLLFPVLPPTLIPVG